MHNYTSFIALELSKDAKSCKFVKDRSGLFNLNREYNTKKVLKIVQILMED